MRKRRKKLDAGRNLREKGLPMRKELREIVEKVTRLSEEEKGKVSDLLFADLNAPPQASLPLGLMRQVREKEAACRTQRYTSPYCLPVLTPKPDGS